MRTGTVLQGAVRNRPRKLGVHGRRKGAETDSPSTFQDSFAFLRQPIRSIPFHESPIMQMKLDDPCRELIDACKRLFSLTGDGFDVSGEVSTGNMVNLLKGMESWAEKHNLHFMAVNDYGDFQYVLYRPICELELKAFFFYCSPAETMPEEMSELYKRYIRYISSCLGISVVPEHTDNQYLEMMMSAEMWEEEDGIVKLYMSKNDLFCDIWAKSISNLEKDLEEYRRRCDVKYLDLIELMLEGTEILPYMHLSQFYFDPYWDGMTASDGSMDLGNTVAILYSSKDGMEDCLMQCLDSDLYGGIEPQGWNRHVYISSKFTKDDLDALMKDSGIEHRFAQWADGFYEESTKFDEYKKSDEQESD